MDVMDVAHEVRGAPEAAPDAAPTPARRGGLLFWGPAVAVTGLLVLVAVSVLHPAQDNPLQTLNRPAPDFTLPRYGGGALHLAALRGKTVMINFWWSGCVPCQEEAPLLERQWRAWKDKGVVFIGIDEIDDPHSAAPRDFLRRYDITYPNVWDTSYIAIEYGTTGQPESFFITPRGLIKTTYVQPFPDDQTLARLIRQARPS